MLLFSILLLLFSIIIQIDCRGKGQLPARGGTVEHKIRTLKSLFHWEGGALVGIVWSQDPRVHRKTKGD